MLRTLGDGLTSDTSLCSVASAAKLVKCTGVKKLVQVVLTPLSLLQPDQVFG